jgi:hypothetical protein
MLLSIDKFYIHFGGSLEYETNDYDAVWLAFVNIVGNNILMS